MKLTTVPHNGKTYELNCYATDFDNDLIFCFATPDHSFLPGCENDYFFIKIDKSNPDNISGEGADSPEGLELIRSVALYAVENLCFTQAIN